MIDLIQLVKNQTPEDIITIMKDFGVERYQKTNNAIVFPTICHNEDADAASMKLYYYPKTKSFHCYTDCGCTFNIIELFKKRYELLRWDYDFYKDIVLKLNKNTPIQHKKVGFYNPYESIYEEQKQMQVNLPSLNKGLLNAYDFYPVSEWIDDGISEAIMKIYGIKYSIVDNKIIIPHYDINDNLIGIRCRPLNEEDISIGKYMPMKIEGKLYNHPLGYNLYGLNLVKDNIKKYKIAIIAEGEKSCMQYGTMFGQENNIVVAACGNNLQKYQIDLLLKCGAEKILLAFDKEGESWAEKDKYFIKLKKICERYKNYCSMGFIYDTKGVLKLKESPFDKGRESFRQLYQCAKWI